VHEQVLGIVGDGQPGTNRIGPLASTGHDGDVTRDEGSRRLDEFLGNDHDDAVDSPRLQEPVDRASKHGRPTQINECLGLVLTQTHSLTCGGNQRDYRTFSLGHCVYRGCLGRGREDLVEDGLGLVAVGAFGQCEFADKNLPRLREHALLSCGQAAILLTTPQVPNDLGDLVDVT